MKFADFAEYYDAISKNNSIDLLLKDNTISGTTMTKVTETVTQDGKVISKRTIEWVTTTKTVADIERKT